MEDIFVLLNSGDKEEIKKAMKNIIIEQFSIQLKDYTDDSFMFDPTLLDDIFANAMEEAKENVQSEIVSKLTKKLMKKVESI